MNIIFCNITINLIKNIKSQSIFPLKKDRNDYGLFCKKGFLSAILFTELFKLICYELNFRTDYNLNRIFTRSDHTGNTG